MRLIDCYIENFGGLSEYSISFDKELTVLMEANGFGKSTLAAFIKAMFYGFPRATKTLDKNERKLYTPWQGGKFGGNLSFEYEGVSFRIERSFGATPRQDTFSLYELDPFKQSDRFTENIGQELFKLDVESYEKSTYMAQSGGISSFATAGIQTKLGDLVEEADDIYNFDKAVAALRDKRIKYKTYKGQYGTVYEIKNEISNLQTKISEKPQIENDCEIFKKQYSELILKEKENEAALESVRKRITKASEIAVLENLSKQYKELEQEKEQLKLEMENLLSVYKKGIPTIEETDAADVASENIDKIDSALEVLHISSEDQQIFEDNKKLFETGIPAEEYFEDLQEQIKERNACFIKHSELEAKKEAEIMATAKKIKVGLFSATALIFVIAVVFLVLEMMIPAIATAAVALIMLIVSIVVKPKVEAKPDEELIGLRENSDKLDQQIKAGLDGYFPEAQITPEEYTNYVFELKSLCKLYQNALRNIEDYEVTKKSYQQKRQTEQQIVENFAAAYGFSTDLLTDAFFRKLSADIINAQNLLSKLKKTEEKIGIFEKENGEKLKGFVGGNKEDLDMLKSNEANLLYNEKNLNRELAELVRRIEQKEKELEQFPIYADELEECNSRYEDDMKACEILDQTMEYLSQAKDVLNYNYIKPVKDRFDIYVNQIIGKDKLNIFMDKELQVKPEQFGEAREMTYFSAGYTDIVRLCMHFALVDVLFEETDCFIILDDPFVNLDDKKTKEAIELLKELSKRRQVVYMTCHSSRV